MSQIVSGKFIFSFLIFVSLIKEPGLCADFPDRSKLGHSSNNRSMRRSYDHVEDREEQNLSLQTISSSKKNLKEKEKVKKNPLTKGEIEETQAMERALQDSKDSLLNYRLGQIALNTDPDDIPGHRFPLNKAAESSKAEKSSPMDIEGRKYENLKREEKDLVKQLCRDGIKDLRKEYTNQLARSIKEKKKHISSERMSIEMAGEMARLTGVIQLEPGEAEVIQMNLLDDETRYEDMKKEYKKLRKNFWRDQTKMNEIRKIVRDALQTFYVVNEEDVKRLYSHYVTQRKKHHKAKKHKKKS